MLILFIRWPWKWGWNLGMVSGSTGEGWDRGCDRWNAWQANQGRQNTCSVIL